MISAYAKREDGYAKSNDRSMGALLIDAGKLTLEDAETILRVQREQGSRFGEAAVKLGFVTQADIEVALFRQFDYPYLPPNDQSLGAELVAAYQPFSHQVETLRGLRSQLMLRWFGASIERKTLAVVSPERGEGRSFIAANLAVVFSQLGEHTLLIDADLRNPRQHRFFKLDNSNGLSAVLSGRGNPNSVQRIPALVDLSVLPAGAQPPNPQELLGRPFFARLLEELADEFDVIVIDTPSGESYADVQTLSARAHGALMVIRKDVSGLAATRALMQKITGSGAQLVGAVLNAF